MSSHTHVACQAEEQPLGAFIHRMNLGLAHDLNRLQARSGPVFLQRPTSVIVAGDVQLSALLAYIHNNPVRAGVVSRPQDSDWTSHRAFTGAAPAPSWLAVELALMALGRASDPAGRAWFHQMVVDRAGLARDPSLAGPGPAAPGLPKRLLAAAVAEFGVTLAALQRPARCEAALLARRTVFEVGLIHLRISAAELADELGVDPSTVCRGGKSGAPGAVPPPVVRRLVDRTLKHAAPTQ
jgi:hypothetical protein